ncbi:MAG: hypothetical protein AVDCRST_MAG68-3497, partial [uncultured Gemmatimonadetes bacterium]
APHPYPGRAPAGGLARPRRLRQRRRAQRSRQQRGLRGRQPREPPGLGHRGPAGAQRLPPRRLHLHHTAGQQPVAHHPGGSAARGPGHGARDHGAL